MTSFRQCRPLMGCIIDNTLCYLRSRMHERMSSADCPNPSLFVGKYAAVVHPSERSIYDIKKSLNAPTETYTAGR